MKAKDRLLSWKQAPPKTAPERATARLLEELRSAPTLSPEALARIERRLREGAHRPRRRKVLSLSGPWMPALAGAAATVLVVGAFTLALLQRKTFLGTEADRVAVAPVLQRQVPAESSKTVATAAPVAPAAHGEAPLVMAEGERSAGAPPSSLAGVSSIGKVAQRAKPEASSRWQGLNARSEGLTAPPAPLGVADQSVAAASSRGLQAGAEAAPMATAPATANAPSLIDRAEQLARMGRYKEAIAAFSSAMEGAPQDPVIERALYGRARCRLALGEQAEGLADLRAYVSRFPEGRFAADARGLLR